MSARLNKGCVKTAARPARGNSYKKMPEIRIKVSDALYVTVVPRAAELGVSVAQYASLLLEGVAADETYERILSQRGMNERIAAAKRRAEGIVKKYAPKRRGLFG